MSEAERDTFLIRAGLAVVPDFPEVLVRIGEDTTLRSTMWDLDVDLHSDYKLRNAYDDDDGFGFDVRGKYEVLTFACQGTGSVFGFWYDCKELKGQTVSVAELPVVFLDSEGFVAKIANNLKDFLGALMALKRNYPDVVLRCGYLTEGNNVDVECIETKALYNDHWSQVADEETVAVDAKVAVLAATLEREITVLTANDVIDQMFQCAGISTPKFNPHSEQ